MPTQQEEAMLNQIIKDWVGEGKIEIENDIQDEEYANEAYNQALQDLTSRIPQLTERIVEEVNRVILTRTEIPKGARNPTRDAIVILGEELVDIINHTLKGGKE